MSFSPLEDLRLRFNRMAKRRGLHSPSTQRIGRVLEHMLREWHEVVPGEVLATSVLQRLAITDRADLVRRFERAKDANDATTLASLLPLVMELPLGDPDRPQMLNCCGYMMSVAAGSTVPRLAEVALEEAIATAPPYSLLQYKALTNLGGVYLQTGRFYTAYWLYRMLYRHLAAFKLDSLWAGLAYACLASAARWIGKPRLSQWAWVATSRCDEYYETRRILVDTNLDCHRLWYLPLSDCKQIMRRRYPDNPFKWALLGSYACALLRHGYPRAALAVGGSALTRFQRRAPGDTASHAEIHMVMAAAAQRLGRTDLSQTLLNRARELLGNAELTRPATVRMQDWLALASG